ncbi:MAG: rhomboid family intramembrane serine protease [Nitrospirota bacterium]
MIPIKDDNPTKTFPFFTILIIAINILVFFYQLSLGRLGTERFVYTYGLIPIELFRGVDIADGVHIPVVTTIFTSMFLHGGLFHLAGNMLYLWIFGNNIEDILGHIRFLVFYLLCGLIASFSHALTSSYSVLPMIGASGAVSGVLGAYIIRFPTSRILTIVPFFLFIHIIRIPAVIVLGLWFIMQFLNAASSLADSSGGVAWFAHVGGFLSGIVLVILFKKR